MENRDALLSKATDVLKKYFGYDSFRYGQSEIIEGILLGRDSLAIMPTGAGKSICYQVPAMLLEGITIVISPLISLMQDQVKALGEAGIHAAYINSSLSERQIAKALQYASQGQYKIIYVAPERLASYDFLMFAAEADISMVTVDEAHCISQWGQDFRPSYLKILDFIRALPRRPIVSGFTATATREVKEDILCSLCMEDPLVMVTGFDRENLYFQVEHIRRKDDFVLKYIEKHRLESGIIYCSTRKNVDNLFELLFKNGAEVTKYHAGLSNAERKTNQDDFIYDRKPIMVATNAFGMGIDKTNVRYVIHYNMPQSMENYYQEAGRAGRDGEASKCILLFSPQDIMINKFLLERKETPEDILPEDAELIRDRDFRRLSLMEKYCRSTRCLRNYILEYFGEKTGRPCAHCGNCDREYQETDVTDMAKQVINCVYESRGRFGVAVIAGTLIGANRARLREAGVTGYRTYGVLKDYNESQVRELITQLAQDGYLYQTEGRYPVLQIGERMQELKNPDHRITIRTYEEKSVSAVSQKRARKTDALTSAGYELFEVLRGLRTQLAREEGVPPYIVFSDKTLIDMCLKLPSSRNQMLNVSGVGENKYQKYGERFLKAIEDFVTAHPDTSISMDIGSPDIDMEEERKAKSKRSKQKKADFFLTPEQAAAVEFRDYMYMSEFKYALNSARDSSISKVINVTDMFRYLMETGYVREQESDGLVYKRATEKGSELGILEENRISKNGAEYIMLKIPQAVQKILCEHYTKQ